jgi:hypothetical protein
VKCRVINPVGLTGEAKRKWLRLVKVARRNSFILALRAMGITIPTRLENLFVLGINAKEKKIN